MQKIAKLIRIMTVAPLSSMYLLVALLYLEPGTFRSTGEFWLAGVFLALIPALSFPLQKGFTIIKGDAWDAERKLAIIMSLIGYGGGLVYAFSASAAPLLKIIFLTYSLSVLLIFAFSFFTPINASGHMCGLAGPAAAMIYSFGMPFLALVLLLAATWWASRFMQRHTHKELVYGTVIPIICLILSHLFIS